MTTRNKPGPKPSRLRLYDWPESAARIQAIRRVTGLRQSEYADLLGISSAKLANYESGAARPAIDMGIALAEFSGCTLDFIYRGVTSGMPAPLVRSIQSELVKISREKAA